MTFCGEGKIRELARRGEAAASYLCPRGVILLANIRGQPRRYPLEDEWEDRWFT
jgi:hypothetical protein